MSIINDTHKKFLDKNAVFKYYLEGHIEVDGDHHSHLAWKIISDLFGNDDLKEMAVMEV